MFCCIYNMYKTPLLLLVFRGTQFSDAFSIKE